MYFRKHLVEMLYILFCIHWAYENFCIRRRSHANSSHGYDLLVDTEANLLIEYDNKFTKHVQNSWQYVWFHFIGAHLNISKGFVQYWTSKHRL